MHNAEPKYEVYFIDYGNKERLPSDRVRPIDAALAAVPAQARVAELAYVQVGIKGIVLLCVMHWECCRSKLAMLLVGWLLLVDFVVSANLMLCCHRVMPQVAAPESEWGPDATAYLSQLVGGGKQLTAVVTSKERPQPREKHPRKAAGKLYVVLTESGGANSVNVEMLLGRLQQHKVLVALSEQPNSLLASSSNVNNAQRRV